MVPNKKFIFILLPILILLGGLIISGHLLFNSLIRLPAALTPIPNFDWDQVVRTPHRRGSLPGNQILHFKSSNKSYELNKEAKEFVEKYLKKSQKLESDAEIIHFASDAVILVGAYLEIGTCICTGKSINFIAALNPHKTIYGFDSFEGLPETWDRSDMLISRGTFGKKQKNFVPAVLHNVRLYDGHFRDTLPQFKKLILKDTPIALLHIDSGIYSLTKEIFDALGDNIIPGTIILFDEFYNYPGYEKHEWKAFNEYLATKNFSVKFLAFNPLHEQVVIRIEVPERNSLVRQPA